MAKKFFESFIEKIADFPFWVKEVIYVKLREDFEQAFVSEADLQAPSEESYQIHKPALTFIGEKELADRENAEDPDLYRFLQIVSQECSIAEITLRNFWTLEQTAKFHSLAIEKEYVKQPTSTKIMAIALYLSGKIKLGDYLKRLGKITVDQLDTALRCQNEYKKNGTPMPFAEVLISLGYISSKETKAIIYIKDESKKRFIFDSNMLGKSKTTGEVSAEFQSLSDENKDSKSAQLIVLRQEIFDLKTKLNDIANIIKR